MGRTPLIVLSVFGGLVAFGATSAGILASQGRLGAVFGRPNAPPREPSTERAATRPAPAHAEPAPGPAAEPGEETRPRATPAPPPRLATASLADRFTLPSPLSARELDELVTSLRQDRETYGRLKAQAEADRSANDRDRVDLDARAKELEELQARLEKEKSAVNAKVLEMTARAKALDAGEDRLVKETAKRIDAVELEKAKVQLLDFDDRIAARVLARLAPRKQGELLGALPAEKRVALTRALQAVLSADSKPAPETESR